MLQDILKVDPSKYFTIEEIELLTDFVDTCTNKTLLYTDFKILLDVQSKNDEKLRNALWIIFLFVTVAPTVGQKYKNKEDFQSKYKFEMIEENELDTLIDIANWMSVFLNIVKYTRVKTIALQVKMSLSLDYLL